MPERSPDQSSCPAPAEPAPPSGVPASQDAPHRPKILIVEDNRTNLLVIRQLLKPLDAEITCAENGRKAVTAAAAERFDVILMDIQMPELDGVGATRKIRSMEREGPARPRAAIVATTANTMAHQVEEYLAAEMDACIAKPIGKAELLGLLAGLVPARPRG